MRTKRILHHAVIEPLERRQLLSTVVLTTADSIQNAINAAHPGDVIQLAPGTYKQGVTITASGTSIAPIRLEAQTPGTAIIDANGGAIGIIGSGQYIQICGLTIRNQNGGASSQIDAAALRVGTGWTVQDVLVQNNAGAGVGVLGNNATLLRVTSENNGRSGIGGWYVSNILVQDCVVRYNNQRKFNPDYDGGGGKWYQTTGVTVDNLKSYGNFGPGIWFDWNNSDYIVRNSEVYGNKGVNAGWEGNGIMVETNNGAGLISGNNLHDNTGWAVAVYEVSNLTVRDNVCTNDPIVYRNLSGRDPYHVANVTITDNTFNSASIAASLGTFPVINNNAGTALNIISDHNTFNNPVGTALYTWNNVDYTTLASVQSKLSFELNASPPPADTTAPTPNPATWATAPYASSSTSIIMTATTASDPSGVQYFFDCLTAGGHDSGWQSSATYQDTGLTPNSSYSYQVRTRDTSAGLNTGAYSVSASATTLVPSVPGTGLQGQYFDNKDLSNLKLTRTDATVNFNWGDGSPNPSIGADTFSARWTGQVQAQLNQTYTFYTSTDDGVRLWVNGQQLINKWNDQSPTQWSGTIALQAGQKYDIQMEYYENGWGAVAQLYWSSASTPKQIVPQSQLFAPEPDGEVPSVPGTPTLVAKSSNAATIQWAASTDNAGVGGYRIFRDAVQVGTSPTTSYADSGLADSTTYSYTVRAVDTTGNISDPSGALAVTTDAAPQVGNGLKAQYFDNMDLTNLKLARTDAAVNFNWGTGSPNPSIGADTFSVRWTGQVLAEYSQTYTFHTTTDDGVRLWVNGVQLINKWQDQSAKEWSGSIALVAGQKYDITMEYYENGWDAVATLKWSGASTAKQIIPQSALFSA